MGPIIDCQEVALAGALCRIRIADGGGPAGLESYVARIWRLDTDASECPQLLATDGTPLEIRGRSAALTLGSAVTYLAARYGGLSEYPHVCADFGEPPLTGAPILVSDAQASGDP